MQVAQPNITICDSESDNQLKLVASSKGDKSDVLRTSVSLRTPETDVVPNSLHHGLGQPKLQPPGTRLPAVVTRLPAVDLVRRLRPRNRLSATTPHVHNPETAVPGLHTTRQGRKTRAATTSFKRTEEREAEGLIKTLDEKPAGKLCSLLSTLQTDSQRFNLCSVPLSLY